MRQQFNTQLLELALNARAVSQKELAIALGVDASLATKWKIEEATPSPAQIEAIASHLKYPKGLFLRYERPAGSDSVCMHHKKRATMPARTLHRIEAEMHLAQLQAKWILAEIDVETDQTLMILEPDEYGGAAGVAQTVRAYWHIPRGPIRDLAMTVEGAGGVIAMRSFGSRLIDGMSCWAKNTPPLFFLNADLPTDRLRWCLAHELGHLVMHSRMPSPNAEQEAEEFARELLIPRAEIAADLARLTFHGLPALKQIWRVPMKELITAASRWDLLAQPKVKSLAVQYSRAGWQTAEPFELSPEYPATLDAALSVHRNEHGFDVKQLAALAELLPTEFSALYGMQPRLRAV